MGNHRLQPPAPTPADELCECLSVTAVLLCYALVPNPLRCATCNKEVIPEKLRLTAAQIEMVAGWNNFYGSVYRLWLDSGEYENWAKTELNTIASPVNQRGIKCCETLSETIPVYLWWFQEYGERRDRCPNCNHRLIAAFNWDICESCRILVPNERLE